MDGLADFLKLLRNDRTRVAIRGLIIFGGIYQLLLLINRPITDIVPEWALEVIDFFTVVFGLYVGAIVLVGLIFFFVGTISLSHPLQNPAVKTVQVIIALMFTSAILFQFEQIARFFALIGLIFYLIIDVYSQRSDTTKDNLGSRSG